MMGKLISILGLLSLFIHGTLYCQDEQNDEIPIYIIETSDGNVYRGQIIESGVKEIKVKTVSIGTITINVEDILSIREANKKDLRPKKVKVATRDSTNNQLTITGYLFSPNAYTLRKGEVQYRNVGILYNQLSVGLTNHFSFGLGLVPNFLFAGAPTPVLFSPKFSFPTKGNVTFSTGASVGTIVGNGGTFGFVNGSVTFGNRTNNLSIGLNYGFLEDEIVDIPALTIGGTKKISQKSYLVNDNFFVISEGELFATISFGGRTKWPGIALDYGLLIPIIEGITVALPWLGVTVPVGQKK